MEESDSSKKRLKKMLAFMNRRIRRKIPPEEEAEASVPAVEDKPPPPPPSRAPEPPAPSRKSPPRGQFLAFLDRFKARRGLDDKEAALSNLKEVLQKDEDRGGAAAPLPAWNQKAFSRTQEQAKRDLSWSRQWSQLLDLARARPYRSLGVLAAVLLVLTLDLSTLARRLHVSEWLPVSWEPDQKRALERRPWESRGNGVLLAPGPGLDPLARSALEDAAKQPPLGSWELPPRLSSMKGILLPKEWKDWRTRNAVAGLNAELWMGGNALEDMTRTALAKDSGTRSPYGPAYADLEGPAPLGKIAMSKGRSLGAFGQIQADEGYRGVDTTSHLQVPKGAPPDEAAAELLNAGGTLQAINQYNENTQWKKLEKTDEQPVPRNFDGSTMLASEAVGQLLKTKAETDTSMNCGFCAPEAQVGDNRATYYGEKY